ncbi:MAG: hypothetical protein V9G09_11250 [Candidatus Nanopelagicales bacterium]
MNMKPSRRSALRKIAGSTAAVAVAANLSQRLNAADKAAPQLKGRINHSVCKWCYDKIDLEEFCKAGKGMGLSIGRTARSRKIFHDAQEIRPHLRRS